MRSAVAAMVLCMSVAASADELLVLAAASTTDALQDVAKAYAAKGGQKVVFSFGSSSDLARQISRGIDADVFVSADAAKMDGLQAEGRVGAADRVDLLSNALAVVVPLDAKRPIAAAKDLLGARRVALAETKTAPAGIYAREWLTAAGVWAELEPKVVPTLDVRAALAAVESGNADAAVVYATDAAIAKKAKLAFRVPREQGPKIVYPVAALAKSKQREAAKAFVSFLQGPEARAAFEKRGFVVLGGAP